MHKNLLLAVGITFLFLGISINPAIAVNPISTDNEEDCSICPKVGKLHLVRLRSLINRVDKYEELSNLISSNNPIWWYRPICVFLNFKCECYGKLADYFDDLSDIFPEDSFLHKFFRTLEEIMIGKILLAILIGISWGCWSLSPEGG